MQQNGLTVVTRIREGEASALDRLLSSIGKDLKNNRLIHFQEMEELHFASWIILNSDPSYPPTLVLETSYDGDLESHLDELIEHGQAGLDAAYRMCDGYPSGGSADVAHLKSYLKEHSVRSRLFFPAFPGLRLTSIRNAIATREEAERFLDNEGKRISLDYLSEKHIQAKLLHHFMRDSPVVPVLSDPTEKQLRRRVIRNLLLLAIPAILFLPAAAILIVTERIRELRDRGVPNLADRPLDDRIFLEPAGAENHLTTLVKIKSGHRLRLKTLLSIYRLLGKTVFLFGKIGSIETVHFARWLLIDGDQRLLFLSNHDGSWSNYLSDFSDQGWGVTSIWGHTEAFPPAKWVFWGGCRNIDAYAHWSRQHNVYAQVWYSAYPDATILNLRRDLKLRDSLAEGIREAQNNLASSQRIVRPIDRTDVQGIVASGYNHLNFSRYLMLKIVDCDQSKAWLRGVVPQVTHSRLRGTQEQRPVRAVNIAFSAAGLEALGLGHETIDSFSREFRLGMVRPESPAILGDTGKNSPKNWHFGNPEGEPVHIVLLLYAATAEELERLTNAICPSELTGLIEIFRQNSVRHDAFEPFGFRDGISQPLVHGLNATTQDKSTLVKTGEFILGYENEYGEIPLVPRTPAAADPSKTLPIDSEDPTYRGLGQNGSYLVIRKLSQDVAGFWSFINDRSKDPDGSTNPHASELLAAKLVGRWRSGAPLVMFPDRDEPAAGADTFLNNDFSYLPKDAKGYACPLGAHIRRANPRDSMPGVGNDESVKISNKHRIIRRGRIYHEPELELEGSTTGPLGQGLFFVAINADIRRQFEFVQQAWINNGTFHGLYQDKDPLLSNNEGDNIFTIQSCPVNKTIRGLPDFVTVMGGGYFFLPGMTALRFLAT